MTTFEEARQRIEACRRTSADELDLSMLELTTVPEELGTLGHLRRLVLSFNILDKVPNGIMALKQLECLELDHNRIANIPRRISSLSKLRVLDLEANRLKHVPSAIAGLSDLWALRLHRNKLTSIPESIGDLGGLTELNLGENLLSSLPESLSKLERLTFLNIGTNNFEKLPDWIPSLHGLEMLLLDNNPFDQLPRNFEQLAHLTHLTLMGTNLPVEVQALSPERLRAYLGEQSQGTTTLNEVKLVIMGSGGSGKTQLLRRLRGLPFEPSDSTHAFDIEKNPLVLPTGSGEIVVNCWDFGGQEKYEIMHQLFISSRNLFIVVWKPRQELALLENWLELIQQRAGSEAPIIVVATFRECEIHPPDCDQENLKLRFPGIVGFYWVSNLTGKYLRAEAGDKSDSVAAATELELEAILRLLAQYGDERTVKQFPTVRSVARDSILAQSEFLLNLTSIRSLCSELEGDQIPSLLTQLESVGDLIYHDDKSLGDRNMVVLAPQWLGKAIGYAINLRSRASVNGEISLDDLFQVWDESASLEGYSQEHYPYFLWLMDRFQVALRFTEAKLLVPQFISTRLPTGLEFYPESEAVLHKQCALAFKFRSVPPRGLIPILTCALSGLRSEDHIYHMWSKGFSFCMKHGQRVFVELRDRVLLVCTRSEYPGSVRDSVCSAIRSQLYDKWPGAEYIEYIPCPTCLANHEPEGLIPTTYLEHTEAPLTVDCQMCRTSYRTVDLDTGSTFEVERRQMTKNIASLVDSATTQSAKLTEALEYMKEIALGRNAFPAALALVPSEATATDVGYEVYELQVYCDCRRHDPVPVRRYKVKVLRPWARTVAKMARVGYVLTAAAKGGVAAATLMDSSAAFAAELGTAKTMSDLTGTLFTGHVETADISDSDPNYAAISFQFLGRLLNHVAPDGNWGVTVEVVQGAVRWVCPEHHSSLSLTEFSTPPLP